MLWIPPCAAGVSKKRGEKMGFKNSILVGLIILSIAGCSMLSHMPDTAGQLLWECHTISL